MFREALRGANWHGDAIAKLIGPFKRKIKKNEILGNDINGIYLTYTNCIY